MSLVHEFLALYVSEREDERRPLFAFIPKGFSKK